MSKNSSIKTLIKIPLYLKNTACQLMMVSSFNWLVFKLRFFWYVDIVKRLNVYSDGDNVLVPKYSVEMLKKGRTSNRPLQLIRPLSVLINKSAKILSIGCRFETELLYLVGYGFHAKNVRGFDMISYSPWVDCGNMHNLPYADNSWDSVILGWVLSYSDNPKQAVEEVIRVAKNGAAIAIGVSYYPEHMMTEDRIAQGEVKLRDQRIQTVQGFVNLFGENIDKLYFQHDAEDTNKEGVCSLIVKIKK